VPEGQKTGPPPVKHLPGTKVVVELRVKKQKEQTGKQGLCDEFKCHSTNGKQEEILEG
jgi:hypothetical protein